MAARSKTAKKASKPKKKPSTARKPMKSHAKAKKEKAPKKRARKQVKREDAKSMAKRQREISVSEFFAKNRHLLGFDNPKKALLTAVKEAVDNSLDACEDAHILPDISVTLSRLSPKKKEEPKKEGEETAEAKPKKRKAPVQNEKFKLAIGDNGPGILPPQIPKIFGKLLYGSKFHRLKMSRGQQGIGISAAGMYGQMTTGKPVKIYSKVPKEKDGHYIELVINTKTNKPEVIVDKRMKWPGKSDSGTIVEITLEGRYQRGKQSIDEFVLQNTLSNPHASFSYTDPDGLKFDYPRKSKELPDLPHEIKPHPYGVELGKFHELSNDTKQKNVKAFLMKEFSRVSSKVAGEILKVAGVKDFKLKSCKPEDMNKVHSAIPKVSIMNPPTDCVVPIGEELIMETLRKQTNAEFYTATTRSPSVYRGNPFLVEVALAYGGDLPGDGQMQAYRFANRVPLLFQPSACASTRVLVKVDWKKYGLSQSRGALPVGPIAILVHVASVWVPFTSESKEAMADYPEIKQEIRLAVQDCARKLSIHVNKHKRALEARRKADYIDTYIPFIGEALQEILSLTDGKRDKVIKTLRNTLEKARLDG
jgi:DNA topoisomerase-6 subunit B